MYLIFAELQLGQFVPAQDTDRLWNAQQQMKKAPDNISLRRKYDMVQREAALILNEVKPKSRLERDTGIKTTFTSMALFMISSHKNADIG